MAFPSALTIRGSKLLNTGEAIMFDSSPLLEAKARLTIPTLWQVLNLPGKPGRECFCPFHDNRNSKAASVFERGGETFFNCFGGCVDKAVDSAGFLALHLGASNEDACRKLIEMAGVLPPVPHIPREEKRETEADEKARKREGWPAFEVPTKVEIRAISGLRNLGPEAVGILADRGLLWCADSAEGRAWVVSDATRRNAQARRMDGKPWERIEAKAWTLPGSEAAWPVGLREVSSFPAIALVEGAPDALAAVHLAWCAGVEDMVAPVAMLGAANRIPDDALALFAGKRVRIFGHADEPGQAAAGRWASQLSSVGCTVDGYSFAGLLQSSGPAVDDVCDFAHVDPDQWETLRHEIEQAFTLAPRCPTNGLPCEGGVTVSEAEGRAA
jgi:hypothetical protein